MRPIVRNRPTEREEPDTDTLPTRSERAASADEDEIWLEVQEF